MKQIPFRILRYGLAGAVAFAADALLLFLLVHNFYVSYLWAAAAGFCIGLFVNYRLNVQFVFYEAGVPRWSFAIFGMVGVLGLGFTEILMWLFTGIWGLHYLLSKLIAVIMVFFWNYGARKKFCFGL